MATSGTDTHTTATLRSTNPASTVATWRLDRWDLGALVWFVVMLGWLKTPMPAKGVDYYIQMAMHPGGRAPLAPYCFRIGTPLLVHLLPSTIRLGYWIVTVLCLTVAAVVVRRTATAFSSAKRGLIGMWLFASAGGTLYYAAGPYMTDPAMLASIAVAFEAGRRRRWMVAAVALATGTSSRETAMVALIPLLVAAWQDKRSVRTLILLAVPSALVYFALHSTPLIYGYVPTGRVQLPNEILSYQAHSEGTITRFLAGAIPSSIGPMLVALPFIARRAKGYLAVLQLYVPITLLSLMFAADWNRLFGVVALVVGPGAVAVLNRRSLLVLSLGSGVVGIASMRWQYDRVWCLTATIVIGAIVVLLERRHAPASATPEAVLPSLVA